MDEVRKEMEMRRKGFQKKGRKRSDSIKARDLDDSEEEDDDSQNKKKGIKRRNVPK